MMPNMARTQATPEQKEEVRRVIRRAAADIYNSGGQNAISVRAIAQKAGVSVGTVYTYFGSLRGLVESLWTGPVERADETLRSVAASVANPTERLRALMMAYVNFSRENLDIYRGVFLFVRPLDKIESDRKPAAEATFPALLQQAIEDGQSQGVFKSGDPAELAMVLWGGLHGCIALPNNFGTLQFSDPDGVCERMVDLMVGSIKA